MDTPVMVAVDITGPGGLMSSGSESLMATETTYQRTVTLTSLSDSTSGDYTCNTTVSPDPSSEFVTGDGQSSNATTISLGKNPLSCSVIFQLTSFFLYQEDNHTPGTKPILPERVTFQPGNEIPIISR